MNIDMEGIHAQIDAAQRPIGRGIFCLLSVGWHRVQGWAEGSPHWDSVVVRLRLLPSAVVVVMNCFPAGTR